MEYSYKFRLYPNAMQMQQIQRTFGCVRFVYNHFLALWVEAYREREDDRVLSNKGQKAKVSSLKDGVKLSTNHGTFTKQGDKLICYRYKPLFGLFGVDSLYTEIAITDEMIYEIKDDSEWDDDTVFI